MNMYKYYTHTNDYYTHIQTCRLYMYKNKHLVYIKATSHVCV